MVAILLGILFLSCTRNNAPAVSPAVSVSAATGFGIKYAKNFNIDYLGNGVKLVSDSDKNKLLLVPKGVKAPSGYNDAILVETPITRALYVSTTYVGFLGALEDDSLYDSVAAVCTPEEEWTTPQVLERFKSGITRFVNHSMTTVGNIEEIILINPDFAFTGGNNDSDARLRNLLDQANVKHVTLMEWTEEGNAACLEWTKFFAAFYNLDEEADRLFQTKLARLDELNEKAANVSNKPTVVYGAFWNGIVYTQPGNSTLAAQLENAGSIYALKELEGAGSVMLTKEEFLNRCRDTDIIIYSNLPQYCPDKTFLLKTEPLMAEFRAFKNDAIYVFRQGYYMNNAKVVEKLEDMISIFHPELFPGREMIFYQKLPD
jgi:iron complex transport system substrate-binding protein